MNEEINCDEMVIKKEADHAMSIKTENGYHIFIKEESANTEVVMNKEEYPDNIDKMEDNWNNDDIIKVDHDDFNIKQENDSSINDEFIELDSIKEEENFLEYKNPQPKTSDRKRDITWLSFDEVKKESRKGVQAKCKKCGYELEGHVVRMKSHLLICAGPHMDVEDSVVCEEDSVSDGHTRKRKSDPEKWKRNVEKRERYSAKGLPMYPTCNHRVGYQCSLLTMRDIRDFHASFYSIPEKSKQDAFILKFCRAKDPKRKKKQPVKGKSTTYQYTIVNQAGNILNVCRDAFLKVLRPLTKHRIIGVFDRFKKGLSQIPVETRGGNHKEHKFAEKRQSVKNFICSFKAIESHYSRKHTSRVYLPSELNIAKMWKMYNEDKDGSEMVTHAFFRKIFSTNFNIGFSCPSMDECSTCIDLVNSIQNEKNEEAMS